MDLASFLREKKPNILKKWTHRVIQTYPKETQRFMIKEADRFSNPVGKMIQDELESLLDGLSEGSDFPALSLSLDRIVRIRAVQDFEPSKALSFIFYLKRVLRDELKEAEISIHDISSEVQIFEDRIDALMLTAFDLYSKCRKKLYEMRAEEARREVSGLLRRANLLYEVPASRTDS